MEYDDLFRKFSTLSNSWPIDSKGVSVTVMTWREHDENNFKVKMWGRNEGPQEGLKHLVGSFTNYPDAMEALFRHIEFLENMGDSEWTKKV